MQCRYRQSLQPDPQEKCWEVLLEYSVGGRLFLPVKSLYSCSDVCSRVDGVKSRPFSVDVGLRRVLSPLLFIVYMNSGSESRGMPPRGRQ